MAKSGLLPGIVLIGYLSYHMVKNWSRDGERYRQHSKIFRWGYIIGIVSSLAVIWGESLTKGKLRKIIVIYDLNRQDLGELIMFSFLGIGVYTLAYWKEEEAKLIEDLELREKEIAKMKNSEKNLKRLYWGFVIALVATNIWS